MPVRQASEKIAKYSFQYKCYFIKIGYTFLDHPVNENTIARELINPNKDCHCVTQNW